MLRRIQIVLISISLILSFFLSLLLLTMVPWSPASAFAMRMTDIIPRDVQFLIPLVVMVMILVTAALEVRHLREPVLIIKEGEDGTVKIVESAITRYIRQVAAEIDSVQSVRTKIATTPQGLVIRIFAEVLVTDTLPRIEQTIRSRVREALEQTLGVGGVAAIHVIIEGFQTAAPHAESPRTTGEVKLTGESSATAGTGASSTRWGRLLHRTEAKETDSDVVKPGEAKANDVTSEP